MNIPINRIAESFHNYFPSADTTVVEVGEYATEEAIDLILSKLQSVGYVELGQVCYVVGHGGLPRSSFAAMDAVPGVRVVSFESCFPRGLRWLPSYGGIVKVTGPSVLGRVFETLVAQSSATVFIFDSALEEAFVTSVLDIANHSDPGFGVMADPGYLIYLVDEDRHDSPTGMVHFLSIGRTGPWADLKSCLGQTINE